MAMPAAMAKMIVARPKPRPRPRYSRLSFELCAAADVCSIISALVVEAAVGVCVALEVDVDIDVDVLKRAKSSFNVCVPPIAGFCWQASFNAFKSAA